MEEKRGEIVSPENEKDKKRINISRSLLSPASFLGFISLVHLLVIRTQLGRRKTRGYEMQTGAVLFRVISHYL